MEFGSSPHLRSRKAVMIPEDNNNTFHLNTPEINARRGTVKGHMDKVNNVIWDSQEDRTECIREIEDDTL